MSLCRVGEIPSSPGQFGSLKWLFLSNNSLGGGFETNQLVWRSSGNVGTPEDNVNVGSAYAPCNCISSKSRWDMVAALVESMMFPASRPYPPSRRRYPVVIGTAQKPGSARCLLQRAQRWVWHESAGMGKQGYYSGSGECCRVHFRRCRVRLYSFHGGVDGLLRVR